MMEGLEGPGSILPRRKILLLTRKRKKEENKKRIRGVIQ
jgi:hypothetical protein